LAWFSALSRFNDGEVHGNREKDVPAFGRDFDGIGAGVDLLAQWVARRPLITWSNAD
jgi:hypothetical protein